MKWFLYHDRNSVVKDDFVCKHCTPLSVLAGRISRWSELIEPFENMLWLYVEDVDDFTNCWILINSQTLAKACRNQEWFWIQRFQLLQKIYHTFRGQQTYFVISLSIYKEALPIFFRSHSPSLHSLTPPPFPEITCTKVYTF